MSNDMKLIMESFRKNVIQEEELETVGSVLATIQKFRQAKAGGDVGKKALEKMIRYDLQSSPEQKLDALILSRGGGSLEDLWSFNDEGLAWDIFNCPIPVISAVGHEVDFTISDYVSDFRCETPSAAAELLSEGQVQLRRQLINYKKGLISSTEKKIGYFP